MNDMGAEPVAGIINLYKPSGCSTAKYVYRLRPIFGIRKVGHAGTLDPFADGVVIGCVGRATRLVERLMAWPKRYRTTLRLGVTNRTFDTEQPFDPVPGAEPLPLDLVKRSLAAFIGEIDQVPPAFSAVKIGGVPSYRLARRGLASPRPPKRVRIDRLEVVNYEWPLLDVEILCGRGTYVRALARDVGRRLGCGACCQSLTRAAVGPFQTEGSVDLDAAPASAVQAALVPLVEARRLVDEVPTNR